MKPALETLRKVLRLLPIVQANQGIRVSELSRLTGIPEPEIVSDLPKLVNLCGIPPYSPADLVDLEIENDRVTIRFAEQFRRPVRLTLREALALDMALAGWDQEEEGPFATAVASIRAKVRVAATPEVAEDLSRAADQISSAVGPGRGSGKLSRIKRALERQVELDVVYFSKTRGRLSRRVCRPYGIFEREGHYYVVGFCDPPGRVITLRADRIREVFPGTEEYEVPEDFTVSTYRMDSVPEPDEPAHEVRIRFEPDCARYARELFPAQDLADEEDGAIVATVRTNGVYWLVSELLRWGPGAEVLSPSVFRSEVVGRATAALKRYGRND